MSAKADRPRYYPGRTFEDALREEEAASRGISDGSEDPKVNDKLIATRTTFDCGTEASGVEPPLASVNFYKCGYFDDALKLTALHAQANIHSNEKPCACLGGCHAISEIENVKIAETNNIENEPGHSVNQNCETQYHRSTSSAQNNTIVMPRRVQNIWTEAVNLSVFDTLTLVRRQTNVDNVGNDQSIFRTASANDEHKVACRVIPNETKNIPGTAFTHHPSCLAIFILRENTPFPAVYAPTPSIIRFLRDHCSIMEQSLNASASEAKQLWNRQDVLELVAVVQEDAMLLSFALAQLVPTPKHSVERLSFYHQVVVPLEQENKVLRKALNIPSTESPVKIYNPRVVRMYRERLVRDTLESVTTRVICPSCEDTEKKRVSLQRALGKYDMHGRKVTCRSRSQSPNHVAAYATDADSASSAVLSVSGYRSRSVTPTKRKAIRRSQSMDRTDETEISTGGIRRSHFAEIAATHHHCRTKADVFREHRHDRNDADVDLSHQRWQRETVAQINASTKYDPYRRPSRRDVSPSKLDVLTQTNLVTRLHDRCCELRDRRRQECELQKARAKYSSTVVLSKEGIRTMATRLHDEQYERSKTVMERLNAQYLTDLRPQTPRLSPSQQRALPIRLHDQCRAETAENLRKLVEQYRPSQERRCLTKHQQQEMANRLSTAVKKEESSAACGLPSVRGASKTAASSNVVNRPLRKMHF